MRKGRKKTKIYGRKVEVGGERLQREGVGGGGGEGFEVDLSPLFLVLSADALRVGLSFSPLSF